MAVEQFRQLVEVEVGHEQAVEQAVGYGAVAAVAHEALVEAGGACRARTRAGQAGRHGGGRGGDAHSFTPKGSQARNALTTPSS